MASADEARRAGFLSATAFLASWVLLAVLGRSRMFRDPGTFWHLLTGERILAKGLPHEDWLTFTFQGKPWIAHQWLAECAMALLHRLGGYDALLVVASAGVALLFTWLFSRLVERGVETRWAVLIALLGLSTSAGSIHVRPALLSMGFFAWTCSRLVDVEAGRSRIRDLVWLLPVFIVWVNCHGAVLGGIATVGLVGVGWMVTWALGRTSPVPDGSGALLLLLLLLGVALTPLVNPYGLEMIRTWLSIVRSPAIAENIVEHGSVWRTRAWFVLLFPTVYVAVFLGAGVARWRCTSLLPLVWLMLMLQRVRHAPFFAIAALLALGELLPGSRAVAWLARRRVDVIARAAAERRMPRLVLLAPLLVLGLTVARTHTGGKALAGPEHGSWPFALKPALVALASAAGQGAPVLNDIGLGGFLAHEVPGVLIFGDDRCELYGDEFLRAWLDGKDAFFRDWVARFDVRIALAERGTALERHLRATRVWHVLATTPSATLFVRDP